MGAEDNWLDVEPSRYTVPVPWPITSINPEIADYMDACVRVKAQYCD